MVDALTIAGFDDLETSSLPAIFKKVFIDFFIKLYLITKLENAISEF